MYKEFAGLYDEFYRSKDYTNEVRFLNEILSSHGIKSLLDIGCGTGNHLALLEELGYTCSGIDINQEMLEVAKTKMAGRLECVNMNSFDMQAKYDAVISMFAVFNHNLTLEEAKNTLTCLKKHLRANGIVILDLYNPQSEGRKQNMVGNVERVMEWQFKPDNICLTTLTFIKNGQSLESQFPLRIYSISELESLFKECGFQDVQFYENYKFNSGSPASRNLIVTACLQD